MIGLLPEYKFSYDPEADAIYISIKDDSYGESEEIEEDIIVDKSVNWEIIGIEILNASKKDFFKHLFKWKLSNVINFH